MTQADSQTLSDSWRVQYHQTPHIPDMDIFGDDFSSSSPALASMESGPAVSLAPQGGDSGDDKVQDQSMPDFGLGLEPVKDDPAGSFITKEKVQLE